LSRHAFDAGLRKGVAFAHKNAATVTEPVLVAGVFTEGLPEADRLAPAGVSVGGVYCHQSPMVTKPADPSWKCELADLLVITYTQTTDDRRALLLQVKIGARKYATSGTPQRQVELYTHWPDIDLYTVTRSIGPGDHPGGEFSFWETCGHAEAPCPQCRFHEGRPGNQSWSAELADVLADMITGSAGEGFSAQNAIAPGDEWSQLIWDLIHTSVTTAWNTGGRSGSSRAWNQTAFFATGTTVPRVLLDTSLETAATDLWAAAEPDAVPPAAGDGVLTADRDDGGLPIIFIDAETPYLD
jgi:hypothetical protein